MATGWTRRETIYSFDMPELAADRDRSKGAELISEDMSLIRIQMVSMRPSRARGSFFMDSICLGRDENSGFY
jgi:hypothetical protein